MSTPEFAVFDTETTGFKPAKGARMLEIGVVRMRADGTEIGRWGSIVDPGPGVDFGATQIHGIFPDHAVGAPRFADVVGDFIAAVDGAVLMAHNAPFDTAFLVAEFALAGAAWPEPFTGDTLKAARKLVPGLGSYKLADLASSLGVPFEGTAHAAVDDAAVTAKVLAKLLELAPDAVWPEANYQWPVIAPSGRSHQRPVLAANLPY